MKEKCIGLASFQDAEEREKSLEKVGKAARCTAPYVGAYVIDNQ